MPAAENANVWATGITERGVEFGETKHDLEVLSVTDRASQTKAAEQTLRSGGTRAVIKSSSGLPEFIANGFQA